MNAIEKIQNKKGKWLFVVPISGLRFLKGITQELKINEIIFVSRKRLVFIRRRLGFSEPVRKEISKFPHNDLFDKAETFAIYVAGGSGTSTEKSFLHAVRREIKILSLSQLGWSRRQNNAYLSVSNERLPGHLNYLMLNLTEGDSIMSRHTVGKYRTLDISKHWKEYHRKYSFFYRFLEICNGEYVLSSAWRNDVINASLLAGESQSSMDLPHAFLWNMIAIETLLTHQGDSYLEGLPNRVRAFIGWTTDWDDAEYEVNLTRVYKRRCEFVHAGRAHLISMKDLLFTDTILLNILFNIIRHIDMFACKEDLIAFSNKVEAERLLGLKPKLRPKTIVFINPVYDEKDYESL